MGKSALDGIKVVEFATMVSGPYCGKLLADMGADVIKVESPDGDPARLAGPFPPGGPHPERSALFLYNNTSKRGTALDLNAPEGLDAFKRLVKWTDILIDNHPPKFLEDRGLDWDALKGLNPGLVYTTITPYGRTGPKAGVKGDELTLVHAGGVGNLMPARSIDADRAPIKTGGYFVGYHGGLVAALATLGALMDRMKTGSGHMVDISLQQVILSLVSPLIARDRYHETTWSRVPDRPPAMGRMKTGDGYVILGALDNHHFRSFRELMGKPEWAAGDEWDDMHYRNHHLMDIAPMMDEWMERQKRDDIYHKAARKRIPIGPINSAGDVMNNAQYAARGFFVELDHPEAGRHKYAGCSYRMSATPPHASRAAPLLGQHNKEILQDPAIFNGEDRTSFSVNDDAAAGSRKTQARELPLKGIRVLDFCWVWAGPYSCKLLADLGAEVIKVEGHTRSDLTRRSFPWPLPLPEPLRCPSNQGLPFNMLNQNKKSLTLDLSRPEGVEIAGQLAAISDVVIDNMRPGAMDKLGLGYDVLSGIRPDVVVCSLSSRGRNGPETDYLGFATIHQGVGGLAYITGYPDDHPSHGSAGDADIMNGTITAYAVVTALYHRSRTGEGQFIDISQCEAVSSLLGEIFLGFEMDSQIPERMGNQHPVYAPHGVYRCWGVDRWVALEIHSDEEFARLAGAMNRPGLADDARFADMASRKENEVELNRIIDSWTRLRDRDWLVSEFCRAGLAAAPSRDWKDLYADRHLQERGAFVSVDHPEIGELELAGPPWKISGLEKRPVHAPLLGQHNRYVLQELLNLSDEAVEDLRSKGVIM